jgi:phage terminase large subunit-like protein
VDLSSTTDLTCATLIRKVDKYYEITQKYFIAEERAEKREKEDKVPYKLWRDQGYVTFTEGNRVDFEEVAGWFSEQEEKYELHVLAIGYDPWSSGYFVKQMKNLGFNMIEVRQGYRTLSSPMKLLEADFLDSRMKHNKNPILNWNLSNTSVHYDPAGNVKPVKTNGKKSNLRIDGMVSLLCAYVVVQEKLDDIEFINSL